MIACHCHRVTAATVEAAISAGARSVEDVTDHCEAGGSCGSCSPTISALLHSHLGAEIAA